MMIHRKSFQKQIASKAGHYFFGLSLLIAQFVIAETVAAQGDLLLMPRRVIFEGAKRYEELNLANTGKDTARYVVSLMHVRMKEDGSFEEIAEPGPGENFADKYIHTVIGKGYIFKTEPDN